MLVECESLESPAVVADPQQPEEVFSSIPSDAPSEQDPSEEAPTKKRNCGRTGPTSPEGKAKSRLNSVKHGSCAETLILPGESEDDWSDLLRKWTGRYHPAENTLEYDFVLKTAQAEWTRIRCERNYSNFQFYGANNASYNWTPDQIKTHDRLLRYKTTAERSFQREYRQLEQHYKSHPPAPPEPDPEQQAAADLAADLADYCPFDFTQVDPTSPTGVSFIQRAGGDPVKDRLTGRKQYKDGDPYP